MSSDSLYTPDGRVLMQYSGASRNRTMFRWLMRIALCHPNPQRGTVQSRTGRVKFSGNWKGGRRATR